MLSGRIVRGHRRALRLIQRRLRQSGLDGKVVIEGDYGYILIPMDSIVNFIRRRIKYRNCKISLEGNYLVVEVWK